MRPSFLNHLLLNNFFFSYQTFELYLYYVIHTLKDKYYN